MNGSFRQMLPAFLRTLVTTMALSATAACGVVDLGQKGCTDSTALNFLPGADSDDGSCRYSKVVFYSAVITSAEVAVRVDGQSIGTLTAYYPSGPGNCSAPGTVALQLSDGGTHDWDATDGTYISTGTVRSSRSNECLVIRAF